MIPVLRTIYLYSTIHTLAIMLALADVIDEHEGSVMIEKTDTEIGR